ncbi:MAG: hypothetical protein WBL27_02180 [Salinimicrobium sp.]
MEQQTISPKKEEKKNQIEYVKKLVIDLYNSKVFYSFSLYTLELSRRFKAAYLRYKKTKSPEAFETLQELAEKLEERLVQEDKL